MKTRDIKKYKVNKAKKERRKNSSVIYMQKLLNNQYEVEAAVEEDAQASDDEASVETQDTIRLDGLALHVPHPSELPPPHPVLDVGGQPGPGVVQRVDKQQGHNSGQASAREVEADLQGSGSVT